MSTYNLMSISYYLKFVKCTPEAYLEHSQTSMMELFCENSQRLKAVNCYGKKAPS